MIILISLWKELSGEWRKQSQRDGNRPVFNSLFNSLLTLDIDTPDMCPNMNYEGIHNVSKYTYYTIIKSDIYIIV
jgi:hypothetical protein